MPRRLTLQEVKRHFKQHHCELLETHYSNAKALLSYKCECGRTAIISFDNFKQGKRCKLCGLQKNKDKRKLTIDCVRKRLEERGYRLVSEQYVNAHQHLTLECVSGHIFRANLNNILHGKGCKLCWITRLSGENHYNWNPDRVSILLNRQLHSRFRNAAKRCLRSFNRPKNDKTSSLFGYSLFELREHIITHPNWEMAKNKKWHIDHIFPIQAFVDYGIVDLSIINSLDNIQPLSAYANLSKHDEYDKIAFEKWLSIKGISVESKT